MEILHRHGTGLCYKCANRDNCTTLCSEAEAYAGQDDTTKRSDAMECDTVSYFENLNVSELDVDIEDVIRSLPHRENAVVVMTYYGGLSLREIGKLLNVSHPVVFAILKRAHALISRKV